MSDDVFIDSSWYDAFLENFSQWANVSAACQYAGVSRETAIFAKNNDPEFAVKWESAFETAIDGLEMVMMEKAKAGSLLMLKMALQAYRPEKFGGTVREAVNVTIGRVDQISDAELVARIKGREENK